MHGLAASWSVQGGFFPLRLQTKLLSGYGVFIAVLALLGGWTMYAERTLASYLWDQGQIPTETLVIAQVSRYDLDIAERWDQALNPEAMYHP